MSVAPLSIDIWSLGELTRACGDCAVQAALEAFRCEREQDATDFLANKALQYERQDRCRTFLVVDDKKLNCGKIVVVAFCTLAMTVSDEITPNDDEQHLSYLIAHYARSDCYNHDDFDGKLLLRKAEELIAEASDRVGGQLILLDCRDDMVQYYEESGYEFFQKENDHNKMMKRILK